MPTGTPHRHPRERLLRITVKCCLEGVFVILLQVGKRAQHFEALEQPFKIWNQADNALPPFLKNRQEMIAKGRLPFIHALNLLPRVFLGSAPCPEEECLDRSG